MTPDFRQLLTAFALGLGFFSTTSCKEKTLMDTGLIPGVDNIHTFELDESQLSVGIATGVFDSLYTNQASKNIFALGKISEDPFFSNLTTGVYIQFAPPENDYNFEGFTLDSAFVSLVYARRSYGDTMSASGNVQQYAAYRLTENFGPKDTLYTFSTLAYAPAPVGESTVTLLQINGDTLEGRPNLRIKLDTDFASTIVNAAPEALSNAANFREFLNGLYIVPVNPAGSSDRLSYFNLIGSTDRQSSRIDFYGRNDAGEVEMRSFPFRNEATGYIQAMERVYTGKPAERFAGTASAADSIVVEGYPGLYTEITIRDLDQIPAAVINKASLTLTAIAVGRDANLTVPPQLFLEQVEDGMVRPVADMLNAAGTPVEEGFLIIDGKPVQVTDNGPARYRYQLNFPRALQQALMEGRQEITLRISSSTAYPGAFRLLAHGMNGNQADRLKVHIIYSKLP